MRQPFRYLLITLFGMFLLIGATLAETTGAEPPFPPAASDLSGEWKVVLENSNGHKVLHFKLDEVDSRLRGKMNTPEAGIQDLDGRRDKDGTILFWSTFYDRGGASTESNFRGKLDGEAIVGEGRFFEKSYRFRAERAVPKKKKSK